MSALPPIADIETQSRDVRWQACSFLVALRRPLQSLKDLVEIETLRLMSRRILLEQIDECGGNRLCAARKAAQKEVGEPRNDA